ncbi:MAG: hypothetical protein JAZ02_18305 [Candidatus Thiodiazotropha endolucinida]|nr:hypothetical protein [Candidatus Thiodiazotropha endolucinida]
MSEKNTRPDLKAFVVTKSVDKSFFNEIGAAWKNSKGGYSIRLNAVPHKRRNRPAAPEREGRQEGLEIRGRKTAPLTLKNLNTRKVNFNGTYQRHLRTRHRQNRL